MPTEQEAYDAAVAAIHATKGSGAKHIEFVGEPFTELAKIPDEIATLTALERISFYNTKVTDLAPLRLVPTLKGVRIGKSPVADLRPIAALDQIGEGGYALYFRDIPALERDSNLAELAAIADAPERTRQLLEYLRSLPETPEPYTPQIPGEVAEADILDERLTRLEAQMGAAVGYWQQQENIEKLERLSEDATKVSELEKSLGDVDHRLQERKEDMARIDDRLKTLDKAIDDRFADALKKHKASLTLSKPRELWNAKLEEHQAAYRTARNWFYGGLAALTLLSLGIFCVILLAPDFVDALLGPIGCNPANPETCQGFSLRGWVGVALVLVLLTAVLWFIRLQMRLMLSERALRLDARERSAYADTYLGLMEDKKTAGSDGTQERAVVYNALFRRAADGTGGDDNTTEVSIIAMLSKALSRSG